MDLRDKKSLFKHINAYFVFVALAFTIGAYVFFVDNSASFIVQVDVLITAKNEKTAINLDKTKETLVVLAQKNDIISDKDKIKSDKKNSLVELEVQGPTQFKASERADLLTRNFIDLAGKYYSPEEDLSLEAVSKEIYKKEISRFYLLLVSLLIGIVLSFVVQLILDFIEKIVKQSILDKKLSHKDSRLGAKDLESVLRMNKEKIQRLSSSAQFSEEKVLAPNIPVSQDFSVRNEESSYPQEKTVEERKPKAETFFKKASSPANLPIAQEDRGVFEQNNFEGEIPSAIPFIDHNEIKNLEGRVFGSISHANHSHDVVFAKNSTIIENDISPKVEELLQGEPPKAFVEPTEEDFKRKLNQLLGNR